MIEFRQVRKAYLGVGDDALRDVTLHIPRGAFAVVLGASGAGKTTLLRLAAGIERPSAGDVRVGDLSLSTLSERALRWARRNMGLTFQDLKMLDDRTALDNVRLPLDYLGMPRDDATRRARAALDKVGLREREGFYPRMMSGGEQQRLAIARAIVHRPAVLLADEPTANLDRENAVRVVELLTAFSRVGTTVVVATHDETAFAAVANQCIALRAGRVIDAVGAVSEAG